MTAKMHENTVSISIERIPVRRGVRQDDRMSPQLFITTLAEGTFKHLNLNLKEIYIDTQTT